MKEVKKDGRKEGSEAKEGTLSGSSHVRRNSTRHLPFRHWVPSRSRQSPSRRYLEGRKDGRTGADGSREDDEDEERVCEGRVWERVCRKAGNEGRAGRT